MKLPEIKISLEDYIKGLDIALDFHGHICPGMYNGVKMALGAQQLLKLDKFPHRDLILVTEIDRCLTDALMIITGCRMGRKSLKFKNLGKFAATFHILQTDKCFRLSQKDGIVSKTMKEIKNAGIDYHDHKAGAEFFLKIPFFNHFSYQNTSLNFNKNELPGKPLVKVNCTKCGETVMDNKHVEINSQQYCKSCHKLI